VVVELLQVVSNTFECDGLCSVGDGQLESAFVWGEGAVKRAGVVDGRFVGYGFDVGVYAFSQCIRGGVLGEDIPMLMGDWLFPLPQAEFSAPKVCQRNGPLEYS
jgi:hypothetical protein